MSFLEDPFGSITFSNNVKVKLNDRTRLLWIYQHNSFVLIPSHTETHRMHKMGVRSFHPANAAVRPPDPRWDVISGRQKTLSLILCMLYARIRNRHTHERVKNGKGNSPYLHLGEKINKTAPVRLQFYVLLIFVGIDRLFIWLRANESSQFQRIPKQESIFVRKKGNSLSVIW